MQDGLFSFLGTPLTGFRHSLLLGSIGHFASYGAFNVWVFILKLVFFPRSELFTTVEVSAEPNVL